MSFDTPPATPIAELHATLMRRDTPEAVAELIGRVLPPSLARRLEAPISARVAASVRRLFGWSSMPTVFKAPVSPTSRFQKARELALLFLQARLPEGDDPDEVELLLADLNALIGKHPGAAGFKDDRLDRIAARRPRVGLVPATL